MNLDVVQLLSDLVRIPSVNPMGRPVTGDIYYEHRMTGHLEGLFRGLGLPVERHMVLPERRTGQRPIPAGPLIAATVRKWLRRPDDRSFCRECPMRRSSPSRRSSTSSWHTKERPAGDVRPAALRPIARSRIWAI